MTSLARTTAAAAITAVALTVTLPAQAHTARIRCGADSRFYVNETYFVYYSKSLPFPRIYYFTVRPNNVTSNQSVSHRGEAVIRGWRGTWHLTTNAAGAPTMTIATTNDPNGTPVSHHPILTLTPSSCKNTKQESKVFKMSGTAIWPDHAGGSIKAIMFRLGDLGTDH